MPGDYKCKNIVNFLNSYDSMTYDLGQLAMDCCLKRFWYNKFTLPSIEWYQGYWLLRQCIRSLFTSIPRSVSIYHILISSSAQKQQNKLIYILILYLNKILIFASPSSLMLLWTQFTLKIQSDSSYLSCHPCNEHHYIY